ncbi:hypothetical protein A2767_06815 [Candidatus Roizmanbacteria bacterium RIFCSPHIGHO2_01_FULL_35_10]|uniref:Glycosyl transferase family 1 domain-containing protein n=1 Tax=Candidatus Roizmanbacteria bacterium RIFCSPLOWO2_01_FULL_35_13 TaxID=1802055 RepID=A0A1F7I7L7_9BACT|nr:MAG: hypothetical protein A2767_06815 [Candidatus Roizmanbacteria bacterium RIFCSPHIGHO2_01_FULL_35_10]OGK39343.1 MAG: hypothetical protein A3A74_05230 [Candidatus Roizmanbacteria bacterium RIFCSPLOWO2_01_FULL_35_13]
MKKAALYDPYLNTLGGGEKHILSILKVLEDEGFEINIFWDKNLQSQIENRFRLQFVNKLRVLPNIFNNLGSNNPQGLLKKLITLKGFDIFFYVTDGSYFFSSAKKNYVFCMVPNKNLYKRSLINKLKTFNYRFITNSYFTQNWLKKWEIKSEVIYPYLNQDFIDIKIDNLKKENIILSVGRFYGHLHSKKQSILINLFNKLKQTNDMFKDFKLILAGGLKEEDKSYFAELESSIKNNPDILLKPNLSYSELFELYKKSKIYIHLAGFGVDENKNPEQVEHLGIAPLEAIASGCLTFCYNAGGPKEIIENEKKGFLFNSQEELISMLSNTQLNKKKLGQIKINAKKFAVNNFNYKIFSKKVKELLLI